MYSFVKGPRLFVKGSRNSDDYDNMADANDRRMATTEDIAGSRMSVDYQTKTHQASASQESREMFRTAHNRSGLKTVQTQRVVRKTTTVTRNERKEPVSDGNASNLHLSCPVIPFDSPLFVNQTSSPSNLPI